MTVRQAYALDVLLAEVNAHAPKRSKISDGGLASPTHHMQNPNSDHEPNAAGVWRARDFTNDPEGGLSGDDLARRLSAMLGNHPAMRSGAYVIWNRRIISCDRLGEGWRPYTYGDPHTGHVHLSVSTAAIGYDSRKPWNLWQHQTPNLDHAIKDLRQARDARKPGTAGRRAIKAALQSVRALRERARR